ncbi:cytochrome P450 [Actinomadura terrae]|uniref:cytochrome P450 n=1 Tax=Actinomadura terrae TaxID=604353 RepID=UPI001FA6B623|nr:cytochrome P450 [Actinomadura terrae]
MPFPAEISLNDLIDDPYPVYARLRREAPVARVPAAGLWLVTRFDDCAAVLGDREAFSGPQGHPTLDRAFGAPNVISATGEVHADLRRGIDPGLCPAQARRLTEERVRPFARALARALPSRDGVDLMSGYFAPISTEALRAALGITELVTAETMQDWFDRFTVGSRNREQAAERYAVSDAVHEEIRETFGPLMARLRKRPDGSVLSHLLHSGRAPDDLREADLVLPSITLMLVSGLQGAGGPAANTLAGLLSRPDQLARVIEDPQRFLPAAISEALRWAPLFGTTQREAVHDTRVAGVELPARAQIGVMIASANRDERRYHDPDVFDLDRGSAAHQAFGGGAHFCAGHQLGRQVMRVSLAELFAARPGLRPDPDRPVRFKGWSVRVPETLPVLWFPPGRPAPQAERAPGASGNGPLPDAPITVVLRRTGLTIDVPPDVSILEAVEDCGVPVPSACREGSCGSCETRLLTGRADHRDLLLTPEERERHDRLMICVSRAETTTLELDL